MTTPSLTVLLPEDHPEAWADELLEQLRPALARLADRCCVDPPILAVKRNGDHFVLLTGESRYDLPLEPSPALLADSFSYFLNDHLWETIHAPAFFARGGSMPNSFWIRHGADRGLTFEELSALAALGSDDNRLAWHLADRPAPRPLLHNRPNVLSTLTASELRRGVAERVARWSGLPIPIPAAPTTHLSVSGEEEVLALGVRWSPIHTVEELERALLLRAGCFIDPALVLALCTDQRHIGRRLAVRAMQGDTPVRIAERLITQHQRFAACLIHQPPIPSPIDIALTIEEELGL